MMDGGCYLTNASPGKLRKRRTRFRLALTIVIAGAVATGALLEASSSRLQARLFSGFANHVGWEMQAGANAELWLPHSGPYDVRLGYSQMKKMLPRLTEAGFDISAQARQSEKFRAITRRGYYPIYREKSQAGLTLLDRNGAMLYAGRYPERQYGSFNAIPPVLVAVLLYVENRDLLDSADEKRNPAIDWGRTTRAVFGQFSRALGLENSRAGGSSLATQIEKFRHSPGGRTHDAGEKLRQMISASLRAYQDGQETFSARRRIVLDYLNSVPLAGFGGYGEVNGLGDGLWAWYGRDFDDVNRLLADPDADPAERAQAFREALSLIIAQRRPSGLLLYSDQRLDQLTDSYLRLLGRDHVISESLRDDALHVNLARLRQVRDGPVIAFVERKAVNDVRVALSDLLGADDLYALDRYDLSVRTTLDASAQSRVNAFLNLMSRNEYLAGAGFKEHRLLDQGDPTRVIYSFTLFEKTPRGNVLRVQTDNLNQPLDANSGTKLDLGSTAKLRTLVSYLSVIADLHRRYADLDEPALAKLAPNPSDHLSVWAVAYLRGRQDHSLAAMLEAAMQRSYSASPHETFFTGGGVHRFSNYKHEDDSQQPSVTTALTQSINLAFVRIMRDVVHYHAYEAVDAPARALRDGSEEARHDFLLRFADREGIGFLRSFWHKYHDVAPQNRLALLADSVPQRLEPLAAVLLSVQPESDFAAFVAFIRNRLGEGAGSDARLRHIYNNHATRRYTLSDQAYLAHVHPLELWLIRYLGTHPDAELQSVVSESVAERREASHWLLASRFRNAQQKRIDIMVEVAAFERIAAEWRRLGYPFEHLVPSLATAIGSSADRPTALADLMGILVNDGARRPAVRIDQLRFAAATPFETVLERRAEAGDQVLPAELTQVVRSALRRVVDGGTAARVRDVYCGSDGKSLAVGGKTGTGDHRFVTIGPGGAIKSSRVVNRAATFVFYIGDRFYGVVTAFVPGEKAAAYDFTSALPVKILKELRPALMPLIVGTEGVPRRCLNATGNGYRRPVLQAARDMPIPSPGKDEKFTRTAIR